MWHVAQSPFQDWEEVVRRSPKCANMLKKWHPLPDLAHLAPQRLRPLSTYDLLPPLLPLAPVGRRCRGGAIGTGDRLASFQARRWKRGGSEARGQGRWGAEAQGGRAAYPFYICVDVSRLKSYLGRFLRFGFHRY